MTNPTSAVNPSAASLEALRRLRDDEPIVMVNLLKFKLPDGRARYRDYAAVAGREIAARGGRVLYSGRSIPELPRQPASDWDSVALVYYPRRAAYLDMQESAAYRAAIANRTAGLEQRLLYAFKSGLTVAGRPAPQFETIQRKSDEDVFVVNLLSFKGDVGRAEYLKYGRVASRLISDLGGEIALVLEGELPLVSDETWENLVLVRYPSLEALQNMINSDEWQRAHREHREPGLASTIAVPTRQI